MSKTSNRQTEPVSRESANAVAERIGQLKALFPDAFSEGKIDFDKLRAVLGDGAAVGAERFSFGWAGRADAVALLQTPSRATLVPCPEESVSFDTTKNLFVEGDNLEVLKLLYKAYAGKVKLIYIDPPYNTGQDFIYPDNFADPLAAYLQMTGQQDAAGNLLTSNPETSGRYHSAWLSMMFPRLFLARQLLRDDGVIFVSIDDHEVHHLRVLMNEIFGEENFVANVVWQRRTSPDMRLHFSSAHDHILVYGKDNQAVTFNKLPKSSEQIAQYKNPDNDPRGPWVSSDYTAQGFRPNQMYVIQTPGGKEYEPPPGVCWKNVETVFLELVGDNRIWFGKDNNSMPRRKTFLSESERNSVWTWWPYQEVGHTQEAKKELDSLLGDEQPFETPKPTRLLRRLLEVATDGKSLVLDFFAGSCSLAQAVLDRNHQDGGNRRFIMVQLPEPTSNKRFTTIAEIGKERIRRVIAKLKKAREGELPLPTEGIAEDLGFKVFKLGESNFVSWSGTAEHDAEKYHKEMSLFVDPLRANWNAADVLWEVAIKEGYGLNSVVEPVACAVNTVYRVVDPEKDPPQSFRACLDDTLSPDIAKALELGTDDLFVCRDRALDDTLAANLALQCRLKTI